MQTGLPPKVDAVRAGLPVHHARLAMMALSGMPLRRFPSRCKECPARFPRGRRPTIFPVRPMPDCTSSETSMMPCLRQMRCESCRKNSRRGNVAAFALNRLDEDSGDVFGIDDALEESDSR